MNLSKEKFGKHEGQKVLLYMLKNDNNVEIRITNYGGIITHVMVPDKAGNIEDVCIGFDHFRDYLQEHPYFGAIVGRYANRIAKGLFELDGVEYSLPINNGPNSLHGGMRGFDKKVWDVKEEINNKNEVGIQLYYRSEDMEEGFPGNLDVYVTYTLTNDNQIKIDYSAETDKSTPINLTNHSYFNLTAFRDNVLGHEVMINANKYTEADENLIPTGNIIDLKGTPLDLSKPTIIKENIEKLDKGYDNNYVLDNSNGELVHAATVYEPVSGRELKAFTTEPGLQFYTGNFLDGTLTGKNNVKYQAHDGLCLEAQHYPDSPNHPEFPSTILEPEEKYKQTTIYQFSAR